MALRSVFLLVALAAVACSAQTICEKYSSATNVTAQVGLLQTIVTNVVNLVVVDPSTAAWFNGTNNGPTNFLLGGAPFQTLFGRLVAYFGVALGCNAPGFPAYTGNPSMTSVHAGFRVPIPKSSYEAFNRAVIRVAAELGVVTSDLVAIAQVLDQFRDGRVSSSSSRNANNLVCQASDCTTSPYVVQVGATAAGNTNGNYFNPPYLTVPAGGQIQFNSLVTRTHTVTASQGGAAACTAGSNQFSDTTLTQGQSTSLSFTNAGSAVSTQDYYCKLHCSAASTGMIGRVEVLPLPQTICSRYSSLTNATAQLQLMQTIVTNVVNIVVTDPVTAGWFNGTNNGPTNFLAGGTPFTNLFNSLVAYFGAALGCNAPGFPVYTGNPSMTGVHAGFRVPISKAAYEAFNKAVIRVAQEAGVSQADVFTIAQVLDQFRAGRSASGSVSSSNVICQASDCNSSPFSVNVGATAAGNSNGNYFNPPFLTVPAGVQVQFTAVTARSHTVSPGQGGSNACAVATGTSGNQITKTTFTAAGQSAVQSFTSPSASSSTAQDYLCEFHCGSVATGMTGQIALLPAASPPSTNGNTGNSFSSPNGDFSAVWSVNAASITFTITGRTTGWIALGLNTAQQMPGANIFWCQFTASLGTGVVIERRATGRFQPPPLGTQQLTGVSVTESSTATTCTFTRLFVPSDPNALPINGTPYFLLYAMSTSDGTPPSGSGADFSFSQHNFGNSFSSNAIDLRVGGSVGSSGASTVGSDGKRRAHGILMLLAWGLCVPLSLGVARYYKSALGKPWMYIHIGLNSFALVIQLISFILIVVDIGQRGTPQFDRQGGHRIIGLVIFIVSVVAQPLFGSLANIMFDPKREKAPIFPDRIHGVIGYALAALALANIWLGLSMYCVATYSAVAYGTAVLILAAAIIGMECCRYLTSWGLAGHDDSSSIPGWFKLLGIWLSALLLVLVIIAAVGIGRAGLDIQPPYYNGCSVPVLGEAPFAGWYPAFLTGCLAILVAVVTAVVVWLVSGMK